MVTQATALDLGNQRAWNRRWDNTVDVLTASLVGLKDLAREYRQRNTAVRGELCRSVVYA